MTYKISQTENKEYIYDFLEPVSNNASSTSHLKLLLLATLISCYFDILTFCLITVFTFHKDVSSIRVSKLHTCVFFVILFFVVKAKK